MAYVNYLHNGSFEAETEFKTTGGAVQRVPDPANARHGNWCIHYTYSPTGGSQFIYYEMLLVPGKTYTLSFYIKMIGDMNIEPGVKYKDAAGNYLWAYGGRRTVGNSYTRQEYQFTLPANSPSTYVTFYVYSNIYNSSQEAWLDQAELWGEDSPMPTSGSGNINDQMLVTKNYAHVRASADPSATSYFFMWTGDICTIKDQTIGTDGRKWFKVLHGTQTQGWVRADYLGIESEVAGWGKVSDNLTGVAIVDQVKDLSASLLLGRWNGPAMFKITGESGDYYKILWGKGSYPNGSDAYIKKSQVTTITPSSKFENRMAEMAKSLNGQSGTDLFKYLSGQWCQTFLNAMAIHAGLTYPAGKLPPHNDQINSDNTWAVLQWLGTSGFVSHAQNPIVNGELTNGQIPKAQYPPAIGDWVYLLSKRGAEKRPNPDHTSHVEMVVEIDPNNPYRVRLCGGDVVSGPDRIVKVRDWVDLQNMNPQTLDEYYYVAHGHPFWQMNS